MVRQFGMSAQYFRAIRWSKEKGAFEYAVTRPPLRGSAKGVGILGSEIAPGLVEDEHC